MIIIVVIEKKRIRKVANTIIKFPNKTGMGRIQKTGAKGKEMFRKKRETSSSESGGKGKNMDYEQSFLSFLMDSSLKW